MSHSFISVSVLCAGRSLYLECEFVLECQYRNKTLWLWRPSAPGHDINPHFLHPFFYFWFLSLTFFSLSLLLSSAGYTKQMAAVARVITALTYGQSDRVITAPSSSQNRAWSLLPRYFWDNYTYCMNVDIGLGICGGLFFTACLFICCCVYCHDLSNILELFCCISDCSCIIFHPL